MKTHRLFTTFVAICVGALGGATGYAQLETATSVRTPDVIYVPTPQPVVDAMLKLAAVKPGEMVYDLGCGDGRVVVTAARDFGARGIGIDIDPQRIKESLDNVAAAGVGDRVQIKQADLFQLDFSDANVVSLYLLPSLNVKLRPRILNELRPGTRIVSHSFDMGDWTADERQIVGGKNVYFWVVPAKVEGNWRVQVPGAPDAKLSLRQDFQEVSGTLTLGGKELRLRNARLRGPMLTFDLEGESGGKGTAEFDGQQFSGTLQQPGAAGANWSGNLAQ